MSARSAKLLPADGMRHMTGMVDLAGEGEREGRVRGERGGSEGERERVRGIERTTSEEWVRFSRRE